MSTISSNRISPPLSSTDVSMRSTPLTTVPTPTPVPVLNSSTTPILNLSQQATSQIGMASTPTTGIATSPIPEPTTIAVTTQGTEGDDVLLAELTTLVPPERNNGWHVIRGGTGVDTLVFNNRFADYSIRPSANHSLLTITDIGDRSLSNYQPLRKVSEIERFQFADITLDRAALTDSKQKLNYFKQFWESQGIKEYVFNISRNPIVSRVGDNFDSQTKSATIEVVNNQIVKAYPTHNISEVFDPNLAKMIINDLFDLAERAITEGSTMSNTPTDYSLEGYPQSIYLGNDYYSVRLEKVIFSATDGNDKVDIPISTLNIDPAFNSTLLNRVYRGKAGQDTAVLPGKLSDYMTQMIPDGTLYLYQYPFDSKMVILQEFEQFQFDDITLSKEQMLDPAQTLQYRRQQWQAQGIDSYSISINKSTMDESLSSRPLPQGVDLEVIKDKVVKATPMSAPIPVTNPLITPVPSTTPSTPATDLMNLSIDKLFDLMEKGINSGAKVSVQYDALGVPKDITIGNIHYFSHLTSRIISGTTGNDNLIVSLEPAPRSPVDKGSVANHYQGREGQDTLVINSDLKNIRVTRDYNGNLSFSGYYNGRDPRNIAHFTSSDIEHIKFNDAIIDNTQLYPQLLTYYQKAWDKAPISEYTLKISRYSPTTQMSDSGPADITIKVKNGAVVSASTRNGQGRFITPDANSVNLTVEKLYELAQENMSNNLIGEISFDQTRAYPKNFQVIKNGAVNVYTILMQTPSELGLPDLGGGSSIISGVPPTNLNPVNSTSDSRNQNSINIDQTTLMRVMVILLQLLSTNLTKQKL